MQVRRAELRLRLWTRSQAARELIKAKRMTKAAKKETAFDYADVY